MELSTRETQYGIRFNTRVKTYPSGECEVLTASRSVFRAPGWEQSNKWDRRHSEDPLLCLDPETAYEIAERRAIQDEDGAAAEAAQAAALLRAQRRARTKVRDLALSNEFRYFVTLTLDGGKVERYDVRAVTKKLNAWLDNAVRRHGLKYVLVPELHKDGAIHFHGFINDALRVVDSGTVIPPQGGKPRRPRSERQRAQWLENGGHVVFNLPQWRVGFTTAIELYGEYSAAVGYVCKYISKGSEKVGGRWFYHGGDLKQPEVTFENRNVEDVEALGASTFESETLDGVRFAVLRISSEGEVIQHGEQIDRAEAPRELSAEGAAKRERCQGGGVPLPWGGAAEQHMDG